MRIFAPTLLLLLLYSGPSLANCSATIEKVLKTGSPHAWRIYQADPKDFMRWIDCSDPLTYIPTAAHEAIHKQSMPIYPLRDGTTPDYMPETSVFYQPLKIFKSIRRKLGKTDEYMRLYLAKTPGSDSSATLFSIFVDEFNAYGSDLHISTDLYSVLMKKGIFQGFRDGTSTFMVFASEYVLQAKQKYKKTWKELNKQKIKQTFVAIWEQAENALKRSCAKPRSMGVEDTDKLKLLCKTYQVEAISELLGRQSFCPQSCLKQSP